MKIILVGVGNIGFEVIKLLSPNDEVIAIARNYPEYLKEYCIGKNNIKFIKGDATNIEDMRKIAKSKIINEFDGFDALICSLGYNSLANAINDHKGFKECFEINYFSNLIPIQIFSNLLKKKRSKIILISASSGHHADKRMTGYPTSKWALENTFSALREEMAINNITVDVIVVPTIKNKYSKVWKQNNGLKPETIAKKVLKRIKQPNNKRSFLPKRYILLRFLERLFPEIINLIYGLKPYIFRKKTFKNINIKSALITGAAQGLGKELAILYSKKVKDLYLLDKDSESLIKLSDYLSKDCKAKIHPINVDLMSASNIETAIKNIAKVDLLINNAGIGYFHPILGTSLKTYEDCFNINLFAATYLTSLFFNKPEIPKKIINILSTTAIKGRFNVGLYSSSKSALWNYTRSLRRIYGNKLQVLEVIPSFMNNTNYYSNSNRSIEEANRKIKPINKLHNKTKALKVNKLTSSLAAKKIMKSEVQGQEILFIPNLKARLFLILETIAPKVFSKLF